MLKPEKEFERHDRKESRWKKEETRRVRKEKFRYGLMGLVLIVLLFMILGLISLFLHRAA